MNKETYEALQRLIDTLQWNARTNSELRADIEQVESWMAEVRIND